jgi:RNA polymerase sigma factor (sigma-70 family)
MPTAPIDDLEHLLTRTAAHDERAFAELYRQTSSRLFGVCLRMLRDPGEAEEVLQEVFITVWRRAANFNPARAGATIWLVALARNRAIDRLRLRGRGERTLVDPIDLEQIADERSGQPETAESDQECRRLLRCMEELDPKHRGAIREAFFSGATYMELATRCQVPLGTMKSWIRRALLQLRTCLES